MKLLGKFKNIHLIGIKGTGMSALAVNLKLFGLKVSGSDFPETFFTDRLLKKHGLKVFSNFFSKNIPPDTDLVISSTAYHNKNEELQEAIRRQLPTLTYPQAIGLISQKLKSVAVCGSHGKTTTSGIIGFVLSKTKLQPIVNVGSVVPQLINYRPGRPRLFVFEADEYQNKFQYYFPQTVVLTNIDYDHPDYFRHPRHYFSVFHDFVKRLPALGLLIYCADDPNNRRLARQVSCRKISYGLSKYADYKIGSIKMSPVKMQFALRNGSQKPIEIKSKLIGQHNALNLSAALICANSLGAPQKQTVASLAKFSGASRRMEIKKTIRLNNRSCLIIDDYGHHPTEINGTVKAIKTAYPDKTLWTVFQPHTFSRTETLFDNFAMSFKESDRTVVLDIYASKREVSGKVHSKELAKAILSANSAKNKVFYQPNLPQTAVFLKKNIKSNSIILTIGAGDVWKLADYF